MTQTTKIPFIVYFLIAGLATILSGCGTGAANPAAPEDEATKKTAPTTASTREKTTLGDRPENKIVRDNRPPDSILTYNGRTIKGELGTYCWSSDGSGVCADSALSLTMTGEMLEVPAGAKMVFEYGGKPVTRILFTTYPVRNGQIVYPNGERRLLEVKGRSKVEVPVKLPPGEYFLDVFVQVPQGDASYSFGVVVQK